MRGFLHTSVVVRYLSGDPSELAERAIRIIDEEDDLQVTDQEHSDLVLAIGLRHGLEDTAVEQVRSFAVLGSTTRSAELSVSLWAGRR